MSMFRFWGSDSRSSDKPPGLQTTLVDHAHPRQNPTPSPTASVDPSSPGACPSKRKLHGWDDDGSSDETSIAKRQKAMRHDSQDQLFTDESLMTLNQDPLERARDEIRHQFGLEILLKHDELRLINQELAKCQIALEQLRRCHLIPYPINCPTPEQMLNVANGKGPALSSYPGEPVPKWAPPFGVIDGPYARHYAKWLIPDPAFDGIPFEWQIAPDARARGSTADGRSTRNSFSETTFGAKGRPARANAGQKLHALSSGYPQPKDKAGPCILKRADGQTVKLVCLDCHRENFSSTQGFINHCRIAHKRDFKSHEEAAVQSGQPLDSSETPATPAPTPAAVAAAAAATVAVATPTDDKSATVASPTSTLVHPFARQDMTEQQAYAALRSRITDSLKLYHQGKLTGVTSIPTGTKPKQNGRGRPKKSSFSESAAAPHLSQFMKKRKFDGNLDSIVNDAKIKVSMDDITPGDESDEDSEVQTPEAQTPVVMRTPAKSSNTPGGAASATRPTSSKGRRHALFVSPLSGQDSSAVSDDEMEMDDAHLSPNTVGNNAPSLVSDDGEYDDSDEGTSMSEVGDSLDGESVSDVAEITIDEEPDARSLRRGSGPTTVRLRKNEAKHVTFMSPIRKTSKRGRPRKI